MKSGGWGYILSNKKMGTLYVGSTSDLVGRIWQRACKWSLIIEVNPDWKDLYASVLKEFGYSKE